MIFAAGGGAALVSSYFLDLDAKVGCEKNSLLGMGPQIFLSYCCLKIPDFYS